MLNFVKQKKKYAERLEEYESFSFTDFFYIIHLMSFKVLFLSIWRKTIVNKNLIIKVFI